MRKPEPVDHDMHRLGRAGRVGTLEFATRKDSASHLVERQKPDKERVALEGVAYDLPIRECTLGIVNHICYLGPGELAPHVVIGLVAMLLKINERCSDAYDFILERESIESGLKFGRDILIRKLNRHSLHRPMVEGPAQAVSQGVSINATDQPSRSIADQQVEECVVGSRYATTQARLFGASALLCGKESGLTK